MQRALTAVLTEVYEEEFHDFSYGFGRARLSRGAARASRHIGQGRVNWVVEADIKGFFDNVDHDWLLKMVALRVSDERVLRLIRRMLEAGVMEEGQRLETEKGTPRGAISPLLANIYLHYALDEWFAKVVLRGCEGEAYLVRYADDSRPASSTSRRPPVPHGLEGRLGKFPSSWSRRRPGVEVRPVREARCAAARGTSGDLRLPGIHALLRDQPVRTVQAQVADEQEALPREAARMREWIRSHLTVPAAELWRTVNRKLAGHYAYYYVSDNWDLVREFRSGRSRPVVGPETEQRAAHVAEALGYVDRYHWRGRGEWST